MRHLLVVAWVSTPAAIAAQPAEASQDETDATLAAPAARQGYYLTAAAYCVATANRADMEWLPVWPGWGTTIRLGQELDDRFGIALSLQLGMATGKKREATSFGVGVEGQVTLVDRLLLRAGAGLGGTGVSLRGGGEDERDINGRLGERYSIGASYAFFPLYESGSGGIAVNPTAQITLGPDSDFTSLALWLGVEVGWWLGLPNNQLALSIDEAFSRD
jgi:hypothetical protein